eukprot:3220318-Amphidinium_carterae.1
MPPHQGCCQRLRQQVSLVIVSPYSQDPDPSLLDQSRPAPGSTEDVCGRASVCPTLHAEQRLSQQSYRYGSPLASAFLPAALQT